MPSSRTTTGIVGALKTRVGLLLRRHFRDNSSNELCDFDVSLAEPSYRLDRYASRKREILPSAHFPDPAKAVFTLRLDFETSHSAASLELEDTIPNSRNYSGRLCEINHEWTPMHTNDVIKMDAPIRISE